MKRLDYFYEMLRDVLLSLDDGGLAAKRNRPSPIGQITSSDGCEQLVFGYTEPGARAEGEGPGGKAYIALRHNDGVYQFEEWEAKDYLEPENYSHGESLEFPVFMEKITDVANILGIDWTEDVKGSSRVPGMGRPKDSPGFAGAV